MDWGNALRNVYDGIVKAVSVGFSLMAIYLGFWGFFAQDAGAISLLFIVGTSLTLLSYAITPVLGLSLDISAILTDLLLVIVSYFVAHLFLSAASSYFGVPYSPFLVNIMFFGAIVMVNLRRIAEVTCSQQLAQVFSFSINHCLR
ncbi:MAG: hypothetical protein PX634_35735 [Microcystis sp. M53600_WE12]|jgi:hypothetical protein|nr:hypothetical protein [Microcystis sp. M53600_WE12]